MKGNDIDPLSRERRAGDEGMLTGTGPVNVLLPNVDVAGASFGLVRSDSVVVCTIHYSQPWGSGSWPGPVRG